MFRDIRGNEINVDEKIVTFENRLTTACLRTGVVSELKTISNKEIVVMQLHEKIIERYPR